MPRIAFAMLLLTSPGFFLSAAAEGAGDPAKRIGKIYAAIQSGDFAAEPFDRLPEELFAGDFRALHKKDAECWLGGSEGHQIWVVGQDTKITDLKIDSGSRTGDLQDVVVTFKNFDSPQAWTYKIRYVGQGWQIDDALLDGESVKAAMKSGCSE